MKSQRVEAFAVVEEELRYVGSFYDSWRSNGSLYSLATAPIEIGKKIGLRLG